MGEDRDEDLFQYLPTFVALLERNPWQNDPNQKKKSKKKEKKHDWNMRKEKTRTVI